jgi:hypothetical protein
MVYQKEWFTRNIVYLEEWCTGTRKNDVPVTRKNGVPAGMVFNRYGILKGMYTIKNGLPETMERMLHQQQ